MPIWFAFAAKHDPTDGDKNRRDCLADNFSGVYDGAPVKCVGHSCQEGLLQGAGIRAEPLYVSCAIMCTW